MAMADGERGWPARLRWISGSALLLLVSFSSAGDAPSLEDSMSAYRDRMLVQYQEESEARQQTRSARPVPWQADMPQKDAVVVQPDVAAPPPPEAILAEIPDPEDAPAVFAARLQRLRSPTRQTQGDERVINNYEKVSRRAVDNLAALRRPVQVRLGLAECVQRCLEHNYRIRYESYNPAISQTYLIEAEAAFDAEFFLDSAWSKLDQPSATAFIAGTSDTRSYSGGFRKLLPTGMQVSTGLGQDRQKNNLPEDFQSLNPAYSSNFTVQFTQPLLRGFGLEYNRAEINIRRAEWDIAHERFIQEVRSTLFDVETAYWRLMQARREAVVLAETVAQNYVTYLNIKDRLEHDATIVELSNAETRWRTREVEFQEAIRNVKDAEDQLKNQLNDPFLLLSNDVEIVTTETPFTAALAVDLLACVRTALDERNEIRQARLTIDQARISTAAAKNQTMPQLDLSFQYEVEGLGKSADSSFDNLTTNRFISYTVSATFSYPIGNRARRAALHRARLQESQTVVALHRVTDNVVREVNAAVRAEKVRYEQIPPQLGAVHAAEDNLRAYQARTQKIDPLYLENELSSVERLASARQQLLQVVVEYNLAIIAREAAKGTLLDYNNVVVTDAPRRP